MADDHLGLASVYERSGEGIRTRTVVAASIERERSSPGSRAASPGRAARRARAAAWGQATSTA